MEKEGTITQCFGCPYYRTPSDDKVKIDWCYVAGKQITDIFTVKMPAWCPMSNKYIE